MSDEEYHYDPASGEWLPASAIATADADPVVVRDAVGNVLADGDQVTLVRDLTVKGAGQTLKRGTLIKSIRLTGDAQENRLPIRWHQGSRAARRIRAQALGLRSDRARRLAGRPPSA